MKTVKLTDSDAGVIIQMPSGVQWENRVGGVARYYRHIEGIFLPLSQLCHGRDSFCYFYDIDDVSKVDEWLREQGLEQWFTARDGVTAHEAWIPVIVRQCQGADLPNLLERRPALLAVDRPAFPRYLFEQMFGLEDRPDPLPIDRRAAELCAYAAAFAGLPAIITYPNSD